MTIASRLASMVNDKRNEASGQYVSKYDDLDFLNALESLGETGTPEVAIEVNCGYDTARRRLDQLAEADLIGRRRIAGTILWSLSNDNK